jgi:DNA end-binding protein Ku
LPNSKTTGSRSRASARTSKPKSPSSAKQGAESRAEDLAGDESGEGPRSRPFWSGTISFGLVTIPVDLYSATRSTRSSLRMLAPSGTPIARRYFNEGGKPVDGGELERGYELEDKSHVVVTDDELEALAPEQSRDIDLSRFVAREEIPPLYFERAYILAPAGNSNLAYRLLASTLERTKKAGIASFVMRGKQYVVAIVAEHGLLRAETLRFAEELRTPETVGLPDKVEAPASKIKAFRAAIDKATGTTVPEKQLEDTYWKRLEKLVEQKRKHKEDLIAPPQIEDAEENLAEVIDLVAVLRRSLGQTSDDKDKAATRKTVKSTRPDKKPVKKAAKKRAPTKARSRAEPRSSPRAAHGR